MQTDELFTTTARATFAYHGVPVAVDLLQMDAGTLEAIEKRIDRLLQRPGWTAPQAPAAPASNGNGHSKAPKPRVTRLMADGTPVCPVHDKPMKQGQYNWFCSSKCEPNEPHQNAKGYCSITLSYEDAELLG